MSQISGRVLVVDADMGRLSAVSEALREKGHEVHAFARGAEARASLGPGSLHLDVVIATADVASELDEFRKQGSRGAAWILRTDPKTSPPQRGLFIASVAIDASPSAVTETVAAAMFIRRPRKHVRATPPLLRSIEPSASPRLIPKVEPDTDQEVPCDAGPSPEEHDGPQDEDVDARDTIPEPEEVSKERCVGIVARDAKVVRRLCESFEAVGLLARGFISARTAFDVVSHQRFDGLVLEEQLDELDARTLAARIAEKLGERAPRIVVLARPTSHIEEPCIAALVRAPATPDAIVETLLRSLDASTSKPQTNAELGVSL